MSHNTSNEMSTKKNLLAEKEKILNDMTFIEKKIEFFSSQKFEYEFCSDSDDDMSKIPDDVKNNCMNLRREKAELNQLFQTFQSLTNITLVNCKSTFLSNDPDIENEPAVDEEGSWRKIIADCLVGSIPFGIVLFVHKANNENGTVSYRGLKVNLVEKFHENELADSVLSSIKVPSYAYMVLESYSKACCIRSEVLTYLIDEYANVLHTENRTEGGVTFSCNGLFEADWILRNKLSHTTPFRHSIVFDVEYIDDMYVKRIKRYHKFISAPNVEKAELIALISKIIDLCFEARGMSNETMNSNKESTTQRPRLEMFNDNPGEVSKKDKQIIGSPQSLLERSETKGKENLNPLSSGEVPKENETNPIEIVKNSKKPLHDNTVQENIMEQKFPNDVDDIIKNGEKNANNSIQPKNLDNNSDNTDIISESPKYVNTISKVAKKINPNFDKLTSINVQKNDEKIEERNGDRTSNTDNKSKNTKSKPAKKANPILDKLANVSVQKNIDITEERNSNMPKDVIDELEDISLSSTFKRTRRAKQECAAQIHAQLTKTGDHNVGKKRKKDTAENNAKNVNSAQIEIEASDNKSETNKYKEIAQATNLKSNTQVDNTENMASKIPVNTNKKKIGNKENNIQSLNNNQDIVDNNKNSNVTNIEEPVAPNIGVKNTTTQVTSPDKNIQKAINNNQVANVNKLQNKLSSNSDKKNLRKKIDKNTNDNVQEKVLHNKIQPDVRDNKKQSKIPIPIKTLAVTEKQPLRRSPRKTVPRNYYGNEPQAGNSKTN